MSNEKSYVVDYFNGTDYFARTLRTSVYAGEDYKTAKQIVDNYNDGLHGNSASLRIVY